MAIHTPIACTLSAEILNELIALTPALDHLLLQSHNSDKQTLKHKQSQLLFALYQLDQGPSALAYNEFVFFLKTNSPSKSKPLTSTAQQQLSLFDSAPTEPEQATTPSNDSNTLWLTNLWKTHQQPWVWTDQQHFKQHFCMLTNHPGGSVYRAVQIGVFHNDKLVYRAPPPNALEAHIKELLKHLQHSNIHPLIASFILHFNLYYTCPFMQHNHFMSAYWHYLFAKCKYSNYGELNIFAYFVAHEPAYKAALADSIQQADASVFVMFCLQALKAQIKPLYSGELAAPQPPVAIVTSAPTATHAAPVPLVDAGQLPHSSVVRLLRIYKRQPQAVYSNAVLMQKLKLKHRPTFKDNYLGPALNCGLLAMLYPDIPKHPQQRYVLTDLGLNAINTPVSLNHLLRKHNVQNSASGNKM